MYFTLNSAMKKFFALTFPIILLTISSPGLTQTSPKTIHLKDGTVLKGDILGFQNGVYFIQTAFLGKLQIPDADIESISQEELPAQNPRPTVNNIPMQLKEQSQNVQSALMSDPQIMEEMKQLSEDQEIESLLSDPEVLKILTTYDPNQIGQNDKVRQLMDNPKIKALMSNIMQKIPAGQNPSAQ